MFARPRSKAQAQAFADQYQIPEVYTDYTQLLEESTANTVYIGLINSAHYPYAK
ncbi:MAG: Gfo/Idh/MocA family oxidoreductase [Limosilactobacillus fermentum]